MKCNLSLTRSVSKMTFPNKFCSYLNPLEAPAVWTVTENQILNQLESTSLWLSICSGIVSCPFESNTFHPSGRHTLYRCDTCRGSELTCPTVPSSGNKHTQQAYTLVDIMMVYLKPQSFTVQFIQISQQLETATATVLCHSVRLNVNLKSKWCSFLQWQSVLSFRYTCRKWVKTVNVFVCLQSKSAAVWQEPWPMFSPLVAA